MSGSDGSSSGGGVWTGGESDDCASVVVETAVESPSADELFVVGKEYQVVLIEDGDIETVQLLSGGDTVGAIRPSPPLLRCLRKGVDFYAEVLAANGGDIKVRVRARA